jgi:hypothetical protein
MADYDNTNRGVLFVNDRKQSDKHPDYKGSINVGGKEFWLSAWMKTGTKGEFISLSVEPKEEQAGASKPAGKPTPAPAPKPAPRPAAKPTPNFSEMDDDLPF